MKIQISPQRILKAYLEYGGRGAAQRLGVSYYMIHSRIQMMRKMGLNIPKVRAQPKQGSFEKATRRSMSTLRSLCRSFAE